MNTNPQAIVAEALQKGWVSFNPAPPIKSYSKSREKLKAAGLTTRGTPRRERHSEVVAKIRAFAEREGVGVTAIYNRIARKGRMTL